MKTTPAHLAPPPLHPTAFASCVQFSAFNRAASLIRLATAGFTLACALRRGALAASLVMVAALLSLAAPARAALDAGAAAPGFVIDGAMGGEPFSFDLAQALKKGPVVLYFYPKAFTQGCTLEANAFAEAMDQYHALGATVIGVSGDDIATLKKFSVSECRGKFPVAADTDRSVMKAYKAVMPQREDFAKRVSYVITSDSKIAYVYESGSFEEHVPRTLAALKSLNGGARKP